MASILRSIAIVIAVLGAIDPAWSISRPVPLQLIAVRMTSAPVTAIENALRGQLPGWNVVGREATSRIPCAPDERCVVIADGAVDAAMPAGLATPLSLIKVMSAGDPNVAVRSVSVSRTHQSASGLARVEVSARGVDGKQSEIRILDGAAVVGATMHKWSAPQETVDIPWWPIDSGARTLRVEAVPVNGEQTTIDNQVDVGVTVSTTRAPVLVFDARPSWGSTFVRRAIEDDARFTVGYRARLAPALSAGTANGRLDAAALDLASVVIVGGPDALTATDVQLLDQYVRVRGGTLILLPERRPAAPSASLFGPSWSERLVTVPEAVGVMRATEMLRLDRVPAASTVVGRSGADAVIVSMPAGQGRIIVSGAMDAWRYRDLNANGFDAWWRSLTSEAAAQGAGLQLSFDRELATVGARVGFTIRDRHMTPLSSSEANAMVTCGDSAAAVVRLWPGGGIGEFTGEVPLPSAGSCTIDAAVGDRQVSGAVAAAERPLFGVEQTLDRLERQIKSSAGASALAGDEASIARAVQQAAVAPPVVTAVHPMRAAWWIVPFAGCLSIEWWLRRRNGLR